MSTKRIFPKMIRKYRNIWTKALRSGKYNQGELKLCGYYEGDPYFCCLGVLLKVNGCKIAPNQVLLTKSQLKKFGLTKEVQTVLAACNDGDCDQLYYERKKGIKFPRLGLLNSSNIPKASFKAIATWIEKNL